MLQLHLLGCDGPSKESQARFVDSIQFACKVLWLIYDGVINHGASEAATPAPSPSSLRPWTTGRASPRRRFLILVNPTIRCFAYQDGGRLTEGQAKFGDSSEDRISGMNTKPTNKVKDRELYASLVKGHKANAVVVSVDAAHLNHPGSPVWDPVDNVAPLLALLTVSVVSMFAFNELVGVAMLVLSVVVYCAVVRPLILHRVSVLTIKAATENIHNWDLLWKKGGLAIMLTGTKSSRVTFPHDWRDFVTRRLPQVNLDGTEIYNAFKRAEDDGADLKSLDDVNMQQSTGA